MKTKIIKTPKGWDSDTVLFEGTSGRGYRGKKKGSKICIERCPVCGYENYSIFVSSGKCVNCGFDPNKKKRTKKEAK